MNGRVLDVSEQRYVDILSNGGFKAFFGDENNKEVVMELLTVTASPLTMTSGSWTSARGGSRRSERMSRGVRGPSVAWISWRKVPGGWSTSLLNSAHLLRSEGLTA